MTRERTIKVVKRKERQTACNVESSFKKTANQIRREMVQTVAAWIAETREELTVQRRLCQEFRKLPL